MTREEDPDSRVILARVTTVLEYLQSANEDHEERIRVQEQRPPGITPRQLLGVAVSVSAVVGAAVTVVSQIKH